MASAGKAAGVATGVFGFLNIAKSEGMTAHDVVAIVRKTIGVKQVGHAGTLDPMATGVLPIAVGKATRLIRFLDSDKTYLAEIRLGQQTTTDDITGDTIATSARLPEAEALATALAGFSGTQQQVPPLYSAVHVDGRRLYELARKGQAPDAIPSRTITVYSIELISYVPPLATVRIHCSAGTYIRSIARDLGVGLGCGGCLSALSREQAGKFKLGDAMTTDELKARVASEGLAAILTAPQSALPLPIVEITSQQALHLAQGKLVELVDPTSGNFVLCLRGGDPVAVGKLIREESNDFVRIKPEVVLIDATKTND